MRTALTIAGSDSGGGAGIQADLKTFHAFGVFGTSAVTAVTAQNTIGVSAVHTVPASIVREQILAVASDLAPSACKTGMLATRELVETVADAIRDEPIGPCVVDPVMVASSGDRLLDSDAEAAIITRLLPLCRIVTPNLDEARILADLRIDDEYDMQSAARRLVEMGAGAALVKGGHLPGETMIDVMFDGIEMYVWRRARLHTRNTHGTGCTMSAAIAAGLALEHPLVEAVLLAIEFVQRAMATAPDLGAGSGPLNHFIDPLSLRRPTTARD
jgi:hydroxymethylpyrimidine/phosphomethylpyrimidine kinase